MRAGDQPLIQQMERGSSDLDRGDALFIAPVPIIATRESTTRFRRQAGS